MVKLIQVSTFFKSNWPILKNINLHIKKGEFVFLTGKSGAGKTTILYHIYMKKFPNKGKILIDNFDSSKIKKRDIALLRRKVGMIFQEFYLLNDRNVFENIALPLRLRGVSSKDIQKRAIKILTYTGLSHMMNEYPTYLSSGEKQRICIARTLVNDPILILADEPTGNLDKENSEDIFKLLESINNRGTAVIMATHNMDLVEQKKYRRIHIENGTIVG